MEKLAKGFGENEKEFGWKLNVQIARLVGPETRMITLGTFFNGVLLNVCQENGILYFSIFNSGFEYIKKLIEAGELSMDQFTWN